MLLLDKATQFSVDVDIITEEQRNNREGIGYGRGYVSFHNLEIGQKKEL